MRTTMLLVFLLGVVAFMIAGCGEEPTEPGGGGRAGPSNLTLSASDHGLPNLKWTAPTTLGGATPDGYIVYFGTQSNNKSYVDSVLVDSFVDAAASMAGYYEVKAYWGDTLSDASNEVNDVPYEGAGGPVYDRADPNPTELSGYVWNRSTGVGSEMSANDHSIDFVASYDSDSLVVWSPYDKFNANPAYNQTGVLDKGVMDWDSLRVADERDGVYDTYAVTQVGRVFFLCTEDNYYVKLRVESKGITGQGFHHFSFRYAFQKVNDLRVF